MSWVELPSGDSDCASESDVELPDASADCCKNACMVQIEKDPWLRQAKERLMHNLEQLPEIDNKNRLWYSQLLDMNQKFPDGPKRKTFRWMGKDVCQQAYSLVTGCPVKKIRQYVKLICQGLLLPPKDGRLCPLKKSEPKQEDVHAFFVYLYEHLAEPLAIPDDHPEGPDAGVPLPPDCAESGQDSSRLKLMRSARKSQWTLLPG